MIIKHSELIQKGKELLLKRGFKESEIKLEFPILLKNGKRKYLDIAGVRGKEVVGVECGGMTQDVETVKEVLTDFIYLPYVSKQGNSFHCSNCDHTWLSRVDNPKQCPKCKRYFILSKEKSK